MQNVARLAQRRHMLIGGTVLMQTRTAPLQCSWSPTSYLKDKEIKLGLATFLCSANSQHPMPFHPCPHLLRKKKRPGYTVVDANIKSYTNLLYTTLPHALWKSTMTTVWI